MGSIPGKKRGPYKGNADYSAGYQRYGMGWKQKRASVLRRDDHTCHYCGGHAESVDHVLAVANGGDDRDENLVASCQSCNSSKGARPRPSPGCPPVRDDAVVIVDDRPEPPPDRTAAEVAALASGGPRFGDGGLWRGRTVEPRAGGYCTDGTGAFVIGETP